jgi:poly-gamma-glutamate synthesis protein (capsule biosynthesis protein)
MHARQIVGGLEGWAVAAHVAGLAVLLSASGLSAQLDESLPLEQELATTVADGFTIATVGDIILGAPQSMNADPGFQPILELLRSADVTTGNYEGNIIDGRFFDGTGPGGFGAPPSVAADLKALGFDIVARANNHAGEYGPEGHVETNRHLDEAGVVYAGSAPKYWSARAARFVDTRRGRVGMVATASSYPSNIMAEPPRGEWPGRGGVSALRLNQVFMSPPDVFAAARVVRDAFPNGTGFRSRPPNTGTAVASIGNEFRLDRNATEPYYHYEMNQQDLRDITAAVAEGKLRSDLITVAIHAHQFRDNKGGFRGIGVPESEDLDTNASIADFLPVFARGVIDAGADVFQGTGVHALRGIEIYKDRPIFYGLGEFFRQMDIVGLSGLGGPNRSVGGSSGPLPVKYDSVIAISEFRGGRLYEVRLHPVRLTYEVRMAQRGLPRLATGEEGNRILGRLQELSAPLGTTITIREGVGYIRP